MKKTSFTYLLPPSVSRLSMELSEIHIALEGTLTKTHVEALYRRLSECENQFQAETKSKFDCIPSMVLYSDDSGSYSVCDLCIIYGHTPPPFDFGIASLVLIMQCLVALYIRAKMCVAILYTKHNISYNDRQAWRSDIGGSL
jgi:hypothetical protein